MTPKRLQWALVFLTAIGGGVFLYAQNPVSIAQLATTAIDTNSGNKSAGTQRVVLATDQPQLTNKLLVTPDANSAVNVGQLAGTTTDTNSGNKSAGTLRVVIATDQPSLTNALTVSQSTATNLKAQAENYQGGSAVAAGNPLFTAPTATATTTDATSNCYLSAAASTNSTNCKGSAGNVYKVLVQNTNDTNYYLRLYNSSSAPTCSSATGYVESVLIPKSSLGGLNGWSSGIPRAFGTGISFCLTGGATSTDNTNGATGIYVSIDYK